MHACLRETWPESSRRSQPISRPIQNGCAGFARELHEVEVEPDVVARLDASRVRVYRVRRRRIADGDSVLHLAALLEHEQQRRAARLFADEHELRAVLREPHVDDACRAFGVAGDALARQHVLLADVDR